MTAQAERYYQSMNLRNRENKISRGWKVLILAFALTCLLSGCNHANKNGVYASCVGQAESALETLYGASPVSDQDYAKLTEAGQILPGQFMPREDGGSYVEYKAVETEKIGKKYGGELKDAFHYLHQTKNEELSITILEYADEEAAKTYEKKESDVFAKTARRFRTDSENANLEFGFEEDDNGFFYAYQPMDSQILSVHGCKLSGSVLTILSFQGDAREAGERLDALLQKIGWGALQSHEMQKGTEDKQSRSFQSN